MSITQKDFIALQPGVNQLIEASKQQDLAKLKEYFQKSKDQQDLANAQALKEQYGKETPVSVGGAHIGGMDPLAAMLRAKQLNQPSLTPAQESAEKAVGKQISDFEASGGRPAMEKNLQSLQEVQSDLAGGKRDTYDRTVGAMFGTMPSLLGMFGSAEKERRDKARNTALTIARQTDPNPTEKQIETIMGQIYDPASSNEGNQARIDRFLHEQQAKMGQMEGAAERYRTTGYGTIGAPAPRQTQQAPNTQQQDVQRIMQRIQELEAKKAGK